MSDPTDKRRLRSSAWYRDVLGCELEDVEPGNWRFCRAGDTTFMLGRCPDVPPAAEIGDHSYAAYLHVDDVDAFHRRAMAAGADVMHPPERGLGHARARAAITRRPSLHAAPINPPEVGTTAFAMAATVRQTILMATIQRFDGVGVKRGVRR